MASKAPGKLDMKFLQNRFDQSLNPKNESPPVISSRRPAFPKDPAPMFANNQGSLNPPKGCQGSESGKVGQLQQHLLTKTTRPDMPKTQKPDFQKATKPEFPRTTKPEFQEATKPEFPKTTKPELPKTTRPEFPKTVKADTSNAARPEMTKARLKTTVKSMPNKIPSAFSNELASKLGAPKKVQVQKTPPDTSSKGWTVPSTQTTPPVPPPSNPKDDSQHSAVGRSDSIPLDQAPPPPPPQDHVEPPVLFYKGRRLPNEVKIEGTTYKLTPLPLDTGESTPSRPLRTPDVVPIVPDDADADEVYINCSTKYSIAPDSSDDDEGFGCQDKTQCRMQQLGIQGAGYITDENYDDCIVDPNSAQYQHGQYPVDDENYDDCIVDEDMYEELDAI